MQFQNKRQTNQWNRNKSTHIVMQTMKNKS